VVLLPVLKSADPEALKRLIPQGKMLVVFDGVCNFCNWSVDFIMKRDRKRRFVFSPYQDPAAQRVLAHFNMESVTPRSTFLIEGEKLYDGSTAALRIARRLRFPWPLAWTLMVFPRFMREWYYNVIANNRYRWWGKREVCRIPTDKERALFLTDS
jgi:predicted DCC family thiol-disulfide oxidoreductase YuxK